MGAKNNELDPSTSFQYKVRLQINLCTHREQSRPDSAPLTILAPSLLAYLDWHGASMSHCMAATPSQAVDRQLSGQVSLLHVEQTASYYRSQYPPLLPRTQPTTAKSSC